MAKYRKKPVVIEAYEFQNDGLEAMEWAAEVSPKNADKLFVRLSPVQGLSGLFIKTLEGEMHVSEGDFVICGVQGEFYPCKPDIFKQTYETVEDNLFED